ncbi:hypothetical protein BX666DRAFT_2028651 [Dichotomocladium elegans]|nr:hypothetical protein BX666DRAFT_2028651 [Dichotomocladium elegans]
MSPYVINALGICIDVPEDPAYLQEAFDAIRPIFDAYTSTHAFDNNSIYYDAKVRPMQHMAAFYQLALLFERLQLPAFACFPLRRSFSRSYIMIDAKIIWQNILGRSWTEKVPYPGGWDEVIDVHSKALKPAENGVLSISCLTAEKHREIAGRCVTVDPGRRDMLYCVHERLTSLEPVKFRYTKQEQDKIRKTTKYRRLIQRLKDQDEEVVRAELDLSGFRSNTLENSSFMDQQERPHNPGRFLMRKLRLSSTFNKHRADLKLITELKRKFGETAVFVMGNWSAPHAIYQEPIRGKGFRMLLRKNVFEVFLIDEYKTSKCCPTCLNESLSTYKRVPNPRPARRGREERWRSEVICYGLLSPQRRVWNRDLAAYLNMHHIIRSLRSEGSVPQRFRRRAVTAARIQEPEPDQQT